MKKIRVNYVGWGEHWHLGTLAEDGRDVLFEYSDEARRRGLELSPRHLALSAETYKNFPSHQFGLPGLVADSLPDGWGMRLMDRFFKRVWDKEPYQVTALDRLAFLGDRAMGALTFEPASTAEYLPKEQELLALAQAVREVVNGEDAGAWLQLALIGGSPQGARPKALVQFDPDTKHVSTLEPAPGTPWLVKFPAQGEEAEVCALEEIYAEMARHCGLDMPRTEYIPLPCNLAAFAIERFDRIEGCRVPMHTLAGALHSDFRVYGSIDYLTFLRMTRLMTRSESEVLKAFERCAFNVIFNNRDDHAKNFSYVLNRQGYWQLAPGYDLTYCEGPRGEHQMDIEGEGKTPGRKDLIRLAQKAGLPEKVCNCIIERIAEQALQFETVAKNYPICDATRHKITGAINNNLSRLR